MYRWQMLLSFLFTPQKAKIQKTDYWKALWTLPYPFKFSEIDNWIIFYEKIQKNWWSKTSEVFNAEKIGNYTKSFKNAHTSMVQKFMLKYFLCRKRYSDSKIQIMDT